MTAVDASPIAQRVEIDVVICTYNRAGSLDVVLDMLARQQCDDAVVWNVVVVDNGSTDATADVVLAHISRKMVPSLRRVVEPVQGLTVARLRGAQATASPWLAFVDDDNFLEPTWLQAMAAAIRSHDNAGGIGGKVVLDFEMPPPSYLRDFGFCFAAQNHGESDCLVDSLAGAGMVLRRTALVESGWLDHPLIADRVGKSLVSGGDVEMAQRVRSAGYGLWYAAGAVLRHRIPAQRITRSYLFRINRELGASSAVISLLTWPDDWQSWRRMAKAGRRDWYRLARRGLVHAMRRGGNFTPAIAWTFFAMGFSSGIRRCEAFDKDFRACVLGTAALRCGETSGTSASP